MSHLEMEDARRASAPSLTGSGRPALRAGSAGASLASYESDRRIRRRGRGRRGGSDGRGSDGRASDGRLSSGGGSYSSTFLDTDEASPRRRLEDEVSWSQRTGHLSIISSISDMSALEMASQSQSTVRPVHEFDNGSERSEFWEQEPSDEVLQVLVEGKLSKKDKHGKLHFWNASAVMQSVQWDLNIERETTMVSRFLSRPLLDTCRIDWVICLTYVSGPICSALFMGPCCSDASILYEPATTVFAVWVWTLAARFGSRPNRTMAVVMLSRFLTVIPAYIEMPLWLSGILLGFSVSGDVLFVYFAFMGRSFGDVSELGWRTAILLSLRQLSEWLYYTVSSTPTEWLPLARSAAILFCILLPSYCLLKAPRVYRKFPLPTTQKQFLKGFHPKGRCRVLLYLGAATVLNAPSRIAGEAGFLEWRFRQEHFFLFLGPYRLMLGMACTVMVVITGSAMLFCYDISQTLIKGFACLSLAPIAIRCALMLEHDVTTPEESLFVDGVALFSFALDVMQRIATTMAIISVVGSRWRMCVYVAFITCFSGAARALAAWHLNLRMGEEFPLETSKPASVLAENVVIVVAVPLVLESILRVFALFYYDMEASAMLWTKRQKRICRMFDRISFKKRKKKQNAFLQPILEPVSLLLDARDELLEGEMIDVSEQQEVNVSTAEDEAGLLGLMRRTSGPDLDRLEVIEDNSASEETTNDWEYDEV